MPDNPRLFSRSTPVLLTRPRDQAERFCQDLQARIGSVPMITSPILAIVPRPASLDGADYAGVILTSENGAYAVAKVPNLIGKPAYCVGTRTAQAAQRTGLVPHSADGAAEDLIALVLSKAPHERLLFARGAESRGGVAERLIEHGIPVESHILYDQVPQALSDKARALLERPEPVVAPLFSPRSATLLGQAWQGKQAQPVLVCLSQAIAEAWRGPDPLLLQVANRPEAREILSLIETFYPECPP